LFPPHKDNIFNTVDDSNFLLKCFKSFDKFKIHEAEHNLSARWRTVTNCCYCASVSCR